MKPESLEQQNEKLAYNQPVLKELGTLKDQTMAGGTDGGDPTSVGG